MRTHDELVYSRLHEEYIAYSENFVPRGDLGGGHREYELPLKLLDQE
jgi:hypothetical protein